MDKCSTIRIQIAMFPIHVLHWSRALPRVNLQSPHKALYFGAKNTNAYPGETTKKYYFEHLRKSFNNYLHTKPMEDGSILQARWKRSDRKTILGASPDEVVATTERLIRNNLI